jgi:cytochrome d ubiquinol oxidase subunit II
MEASNLALFWAGVIAFAIIVYVILDGFDLGVGILFGTTRDDEHRRDMMDAIAPFWDGNETWLVIIGAGLFAAFPVVYAVFLGAFYIPVLLLLFGLIFRGVAFEFRYRSERMRWLWDWGFAIGSAVVAFVQGAAVGTMIEGIPVANNQYAGGPFEWLAPFPVLTGVGLVLGYSLLGAAWLVLKTGGTLQSWAYARIPWLGGATVAVIVIAIIFTLDRSAIAQSHWGERPWGIVFAIVALLAVAAAVMGALRRREVQPFVMTSVFFAAAFLTLATLFWPHMVPYAITVANAAAPQASLEFLFWGAGLFVLPVILAYTVAVYWIFRGKARRYYGTDVAQQR